MTEAKAATEGTVEVMFTDWTKPAVVRLSAGSAEEGAKTAMDFLDATS